MESLSFANYDDSTDSENDEDDEAAAYTERDEGAELRDSHIQAERFIQAICQNQLPTGDSDYVSYLDHEDSPLAQCGLHHYRTKKELKEERDEPVNLPEYRECFPEPAYDHFVVTADNADDFGIDPDYFGEDTDPITVPESLELPKNDDGNVAVEGDSSESDDRLTPEEATDIMTNGHKVGDKTAGAAFNALEEAGAKIVWE
jgi:hypothetical protein